MSKVNKTEAIKQEETPLLETRDLSADGQVSAEDSSIGNTHSRRVVVSWSGTSDELKHGATVAITNGADLFKPQYDIEKLDEESKSAMSKLDLSKGIVTNIKLKSVFSNVDDSVTLSMNLYKNKPQIVNNVGHLYTPTRTDMGTVHTSSMDGFENLANVLPYEKARMDTDVYVPSNLLNSRFIDQYGGYTLENLWSNIVSFPNKDYFYVDRNHILLKVINRNWEMLGMNLDQEASREGTYVKVQKDIVNNVISQLYENIISQIPYTEFDNLSVKFQSNAPSKNDELKLVAELLVEYKFPMGNIEGEAEAE
jgi:hypothetical protein